MQLAVDMLDDAKSEFSCKKSRFLKIWGAFIPIHWRTLLKNRLFFLFPLLPKGSFHFFKQLFPRRIPIPGAIMSIPPGVAGWLAVLCWKNLAKHLVRWTVLRDTENQIYVILCSCFSCDFSKNFWGKFRISFLFNVKHQDFWWMAADASKKGALAQQAGNLPPGVAGLFSVGVHRVGL